MPSDSFFNADSYHIIYYNRRGSEEGTHVKFELSHANRDLIGENSFSSLFCLSYL